MLRRPPRLAGDQQRGGKRAEARGRGSRGGGGAAGRAEKAGKIKGGRAGGGKMNAKKRVVPNFTFPQYAWACGLGGYIIYNIGYIKGKARSHQPLKPTPVQAEYLEQGMFRCLLVFLNTKTGSSLGDCFFLYQVEDHAVEASLRGPA